MKSLKISLIAVTVVATLLLAVGCNTTQQTTAYNTIASVDTAAKAAVDGYYTAVARKLAPTNNVPLVAKAYGDLEASCALAATTAQNGTNAFAPAELTQELGELISLTTNIVTQVK